MSQDVPVAPEIIKWARIRSGLGFEGLAKHFPKLEAWELGQSMPTYKELERFAKKTHTPLGNFFLPHAPSIDMNVPDFRTMGDLEISNPSPDLLETIDACIARQEWFHDYAITNGVDPVEVAGSIDRFADIAATGQEIRSLLEFEVQDRSEFSNLDEVYRHLAERLDSLGVLVMKNGIVGLNTHRPLNPEEFRGFALVDEYAPLIFVNGADAKSGHIFTLCHEFIHIAIGQSAITNEPPPEIALISDSDQGIERWCNRAAGEVLVPAEDLKQEFDDSRPIELEIHRLSRRYKASKYAVLHSLKDAQCIEWQTFLVAYNNLKDGWGDAPPVKKGKGGGDFYRSQVVRLGRRLSSALVADTLEGRTQYADAYRLLGSKKPATFQRFAKELGLR